MNRSFLQGAALVALGGVLGWGFGRIPGLGGAASEKRRQVAGMAGPGVAGNLTGWRGRAGDEGNPGSGPFSDGTRALDRDRIAALAAKFSALRGKEENAVAVVDGLVGLAGLNSADFTRLLELMEQDGKVNEEAAMFPLYRWAAVDPAAALAYVLGRKELKSNERMIRAIVQELAKTNLPAAKASLEQLQGEEKEAAQRAIVMAMQQKDPVAALAYARELKDVRAENGVLVSWAKQDPAAAAAALPTGNAAMKQAVETVANAWAQKDRPAFEQWAAGLTDPGERGIARQAALTLDAMTDPRQTAQETAAWLAREPGAQEAAAELPVFVAQQWWEAKGPPPEVAAWAGALPEGPARNSAVAEVGRLWLEQDELAASAWANTLEQGKGRDQVVRAIVQKISQDTPADAFAWAGTIQQEGLRSDVLAESIGTWAKQDAAAAMAAVATLPEGQQGNLLKLIEKAQGVKK